VRRGAPTVSSPPPRKTSPSTAARRTRAARQVFDGAAKRWGEHPKTKALVAEWKEIEAGWKTQDEAAKAAQLPRMQVMWNEAMGLLRAEVEQSASEAGVK